jgi:NADPH:quinone reductase-like Zn-dependent oxidoreductase
LPLTGLTAIQALESAGIKENDRILIHAGSGGVGSFAIQYAKAKGAIVYTTTSSKNVDWVKALGADRVIDYKTEDYKEVANNLDIVFDTLGNDFTFNAFEIIKEGGKVTTIVGPPDEETAKKMGMKDYKLTETLATLIDKKSAVYNLTWMQPDAKQLNTISKMVEERYIKPTVDLIYSLKDGIDAYLYLATGRAKGKVIISLS